VSLIETSENDDEGDTMLVIGRQVVNDANRRLDLVALDNTGAIILIEVKRDPRDMMYRKDNAEIQAVRYAASLATLRTIDDLVATLYGPYIHKFQPEQRAEDGGVRSADEWATKKITEFIRDKQLEPSQINNRQKIVLVGAGFDADTRSAAAWMAENGLPIRVIEVRPKKIGGDYFPVIAAVGLGVAAMAEFMVLSQLRLVRHGVVTQAIVDQAEVSYLARRGGGLRVEYHFFTEDGRTISGRLVMSKSDAELWPPGRRITVIYDPAKPTRHALAEHLWAVEWEFAKTDNDDFRG
jgi:hypothetical protein